MSHKKYYAMTLLVGFLAIPLLVPILAFALLVAPDLVGIPSGRWQDMGLVIAPLVALATSTSRASTRSMAASCTAELSGCGSSSTTSAPVARNREIPS